jgi:hypothetical protein
MSFIAGIVNLETSIDSNAKNRFLKSLKNADSRLPWSMNVNNQKNFILAQAGFSDMWQGPKILTGLDYGAVGTGIQWRNIPLGKGALEYLKKVFRDGEIYSDYFDYFSCAFIFLKEAQALLANDPSCISPIFYMIEKKKLVFSSHQSFMREYLCNSNFFNWQAILEYLIIGHTIGEKSLLSNVKTLKSGYMLKFTINKCEIKSYAGLDNIDINKKLSRIDATDLIFEELIKKFNGYEKLTNKNFCGLLSGGWDSRLIASLLNQNERLQITYTTQQQMNRVNNILISEKKIAKEVANYLGIDNEFIQNSIPDLFTLINYHWKMDFLTWFGFWGIKLTDHIPYGKFVIVDGIAGDLFLRGSRLDKVFFELIQKNDKTKAIEIIHKNYLKGLHYFTPSIDCWRGIIKSRFLESFSENLKNDISAQINEFNSENFIIPFFALNRIRKGTSVFQRLLLGTKGPVAMPFTNLNFMKVALSIPLEYLLDFSLYKSLLEKSKPGLSTIVSTNLKNVEELKDYLIYGASNNGFMRKAKNRIKKYHPVFYNLIKKMKNKDNDVSMNDLQRYIKGMSTEDFCEILTPEFLQTIKSTKNEKIFEKIDFINKILPLNEFLKSKK